MAPSTIVPKSDTDESSTYKSMELRKKKRMKRLEDINVINKKNRSIRHTAQVRIKNNNFARYKFDSNITTLTSGGVLVQEFVIPNGRARLKSTKTFYVIVDVTNPSNSDTEGFHPGLLQLTAKVELTGKVKFTMVLKKKKSAEINCTISINLSTNFVQDLICQ
ncbi:late embryogenesis abundant protein At1g64065-like [Coffea arabica]|uniref:Late embryogenesis abundant protein At1g64065-like n=1 Tax=Coffea arabica TaxID=13443 RepID=A0ABM4WQ73_COFAR